MRIGVNIPNDLMRRLEPLKPELNVSEVCREAITKRVEKYERAIVSLDDARTRNALDETIAAEIEHWSATMNFDWEELGYEDAVNWVASATWSDWDARVKALGFLERQSRPTWEIQRFLRGRNGNVAKTFEERRQEFWDMRDRLSDELLDWLDDNGILTDWEAAERDYGRAWSVYLTAAWQLICERKDEHLEFLREQRAEKRRNRPQPSIPDHLFDDDQDKPDPFFTPTHPAGLNVGNQEVDNP